MNTTKNLECIGLLASVLIDHGEYQITGLVILIASGIYFTATNEFDKIAVEILIYYSLVLFTKQVVLQTYSLRINSSGNW